MLKFIFKIRNSIIKIQQLQEAGIRSTELWAERPTLLFSICLKSETLVYNYMLI